MKIFKLGVEVFFILLLCTLVGEGMNFLTGSDLTMAEVAVGFLLVEEADRRRKERERA